MLTFVSTTIVLQRSRNSYRVLQEDYWLKERHTSAGGGPSTVIDTMCSPRRSIRPRARFSSFSSLLPFGYVKNMQLKPNSSHLNCVLEYFCAILSFN